MTDKDAVTDQDAMTGPRVVDVTDVKDRPCWRVGPTGFLINREPLVTLSGKNLPIADRDAAFVDRVAAGLPDMLASGELRGRASQWPVVDLRGLRRWADGRASERAFSVYAHLANAFVWADAANPASVLPAAIAVPLAELADQAARPPILAYAHTALANFHRLDPTGPIEVDNLRLVQQLVGDDDEAGFHLVHVQIEAEAGPAMAHLQSAGVAVRRREVGVATAALAGAAAAIQQMTDTFTSILRRCRPEFFFQTLRPYLFGFTDVVFAGVQAYRGRPQTLRGQSAAQSSAVPALQRHLGLRHSDGDLSRELEAMLAHMPGPHRAHLAAIDTALLRRAVVDAAQPTLTAAYDRCVTTLADFRSLHLGMAHRYVASRVVDPRGTGGTDFMPWLRSLRDETRQHLLGSAATVSLPEAAVVGRAEAPAPRSGPAVDHDPTVGADNAR